MGAFESEDEYEKKKICIHRTGKISCESDSLSELSPTLKKSPFYFLQSSFPDISKP